ncbi:MAG TPA: hypothetical protein VHK26_07415 [Methyloceanibacter sp.]|jgi:hypothetical protein|nr:hypothetical protein [Methyloceanibacter sp.]
MLKRVVLAGLLATLGGVAQAAQEQNWLTQDGKVLPTAMREVCTTTNWGDEVRTECRTETLIPGKANPALKGICMTSYGRRTCY